MDAAKNKWQISIFSQTAAAVCQASALPTNRLSITQALLKKLKISTNLKWKRTRYMGEGVCIPCQILSLESPCQKIYLKKLTIQVRKSIED